ncbi:MAG: 3-hydroxybenzoate 6-monooxygenase [Alphaproteobacteria bacterium]|nr:3-hydroxybenzoate 6-monooxygenase [Alphaproteobacteria bacterium]
MPDSREILIVGGGIGGLAAALALAQAGVPSRVLEQASRFGEIGAGIQLGPNVFRMFDRLGIRARIDENAVFVEQLIMKDSLSAETITEVPLGVEFRGRFENPYAVSHRADVHEALLEACQESQIVALEHSQRIAAIEDTGDEVIAVTDTGKTYRGAALIGADGLWSRVRTHLFGDGKPRVSGHVAYRAVLPFDEFPEDLRWDAATLWAGPRNHLVHYPLRRRELFNIVAVFHDDAYVEGWNEPGDRAALMRRFEGVSPLPMSILERVESWRMWVLCDRDPTDVWSKGRITLLGDAAHPMLQYFAQGACMAVEDAVCLADRLAAAGGDAEAAFKAYERARYLRTGRVQLMARFLGDVYHAEGVARELRNQMLSGRTAQQSHDGLAWLYGGP